MACPAAGDLRRGSFSSSCYGDYRMMTLPGCVSSALATGGDDAAEEKCSEVRGAEGILTSYAHASSRPDTPVSKKHKVVLCGGLGDEEEISGVREDSLADLAANFFSSLSDSIQEVEGNGLLGCLFPVKEGIPVRVSTVARKYLVGETPPPSPGREFPFAARQEAIPWHEGFHTFDRLESGVAEKVPVLSKSQVKEPYKEYDAKICLRAGEMAALLWKAALERSYTFISSFLRSLRINVRTEKDPMAISRVLIKSIAFLEVDQLRSVIARVARECFILGYITVSMDGSKGLLSQYKKSIEVDAKNLLLSYKKKGKDPWLFFELSTLYDIIHHLPDVSSSASRHTALPFRGMRIDLSCFYSAFARRLGGERLKNILRIEAYKYGTFPGGGVVNSIYVLFNMLLDRKGKSWAASCNSWEVEWAALDAMTYAALNADSGAVLGQIRLAFTEAVIL
jgi:hypothetical protein